MLQCILSVKLPCAQQQQGTPRPSHLMQQQAGSLVEALRSRLLMHQRDTWRLRTSRRWMLPWCFLEVRRHSWRSGILLSRGPDLLLGGPVFRKACHAGGRRSWVGPLRHMQWRRIVFLRRHGLWCRKRGQNCKYFAEGVICSNKIWRHKSICNFESCGNHAAPKYLQF